MYQLHMFVPYQIRCKECGKQYVPIHPDIATYPGVPWVEYMSNLLGFCNAVCRHNFNAYHEYLTRDDLDREDE